MTGLLGVHFGEFPHFEHLIEVIIFPCAGDVTAHPCAARTQK
jgi:hypothetical protein